MEGEADLLGRGRRRTATRCSTPTPRPTSTPTPTPTRTTRRDEAEDDDEAELAYDLAEWDDDRLDALFDALQHDEHPLRLDGDELFVHATTSSAVDEIVERASRQPRPTPRRRSGQLEVMGELFVAADRLQHDPDDTRRAAALLDAGRRRRPRPARPTAWTRRGGTACASRSTALADLLEAAKPDDDEVIAAAAELRHALRPYV